MVKTTKKEKKAVKKDRENIAHFVSVFLEEFHKGCRMLVEHIEQLRKSIESKNKSSGEGVKEEIQQLKQANV